MHPIFSIWHCDDPPFGLVSIISLSFELIITHRFFYGLIVLQGILCQNFKFFLNRLDRQSFSSARVHWSMSEFRALGIVSIISLSSKLIIMHHFFINFLFFKEYYFQISNFFSTGSTGPQSFSLARIHWSMSEFGALRLVSIISPSSKLGITYHFFMDSLFFKEYYLKISNFFSTSSIGAQSFSSARVHWSMSKFGALGLV